eukprot:SAG11_NODE_1104_length_5859_cov_4.321528_3_plen_941_part_00
MGNSLAVSLMNPCSGVSLLLNEGLGEDHIQGGKVFKPLLNPDKKRQMVMMFVKCKHVSEDGKLNVSDWRHVLQIVDPFLSKIDEDAVEKFTDMYLCNTEGEFNDFLELLEFWGPDLIESIFGSRPEPDPESDFHLSWDCLFPSPHSEPTFDYAALRFLGLAADHLWAATPLSRDPAVPTAGGQPHFSNEHGAHLFYVRAKGKRPARWVIRENLHILYTWENFTYPATLDYLKETLHIIAEHEFDEHYDIDNESVDPEWLRHKTAWLKMQEDSSGVLWWEKHLDFLANPFDKHPDRTADLHLQVYWKLQKKFVSWLGEEEKRLKNQILYGKSKNIRLVRTDDSNYYVLKYKSMQGLSLEQQVRSDQWKMWILSINCAQDYFCTAACHTAGELPLGRKAWDYVDPMSGEWISASFTLQGMDQKDLDTYEFLLIKADRAAAKTAHSQAAVVLEPSHIKIEQGSREIRPRVGTPPRSRALSPERTECKEARTAWEAVDTDGGGSLDMSELRTVFQHLGRSEAYDDDAFERAYRNIDRDASGVIEYGEFEKWFQTLGMAKSLIQSTCPDARVAWQAVDSDGGGELDKSELRSVFRQLGRSEAYDDDAFEKAYSKIDHDASGVIEYGEFESWFKTLGDAKSLIHNPEARAAWEKIDTDGGGSLDEEETRLVFKQLGMKLSEAEFHDAFLKIDSDGSGHIEYDEFEMWFLSLGAKKKLIGLSNAHKQFVAADGSIVVLEHKVNESVLIVDRFPEKTFPGGFELSSFNGVYKVDVLKSGQLDDLIEEEGVGFYMDEDEHEVDEAQVVAQVAYGQRPRLPRPVWSNHEGRFLYWSDTHGWVFNDVVIGEDGKLVEHDIWATLRGLPGPVPTGRQVPCLLWNGERVERCPLFIDRDEVEEMSTASVAARWKLVSSAIHTRRLFRMDKQGEEKKRVVRCHMHVSLPPNARL